ncbi:MAG: SCO family protein [Bacteroidetes bacterium]|nr:SCO family protein [Bacteroidota bacterium]MBS1649406.1 SCO family protein [Bacteroidota bacterium]
MNKKKILYYLLFFIVLTIVFQVFIFKGTDFFNKSSLPKRSRIESFSFLNQDGNVFTNTNMQGKVCVVNYFFTTCKGICPKMNNNMKLIYEAFKNEPNFLIVSSTCNPGTDSVSVIKHYADSLKVDTKKWVFLTGRKDSLYNIARNSYGIDDPKRALANIDDDFMHTQFFALVDKNGNVRGGVYDGLKNNEIEKLKKDIAGLLKEKQEQ